MPTSRIHIYRVTGPYHVGDGRANTWRKFDVTTCTSDGLPTGQFGTFDPFVASLCQRAKDQEFAVDVTWRDTRYGREIVKGGARKAEEAA